MPYFVLFYDNHEEKKNLLYAFGDIDFSADYQCKIKNITLFLGPELVVPLSPANEYKNREGMYTPGGEFVQTGINFFATGVRDPIVWNVKLKYLAGLPKKDRFYTSWQPGNITLAAGLTHLMNERFGLSFELYQQISLPQINDGVSEIDGFSSATVVKVNNIILFKKDYVRVGIEYYAFPINKPLAINITYGHTFSLK